MKKRTGRILMVDDEVGLLEMASSILRREGHVVATATSGTQALARVAEEEFDVILLDLRMPGMDGLEFLEQHKSRKGRAEVVILTAYATVDSAVQAMKLGAYGYVSKPFAADEVLAEIDKILEVQQLRTENAQLRRQQQSGLARLVGQHESMQKIGALIKDLAPTHIPVLIRGESGTGKELVARALHELSERPDQPFVSCNCAAWAAGLLESELFGHVKGAFTGAVRDRQGRLEMADGGTLFLDEVGDLSLETQIHLLRALDSEEFEPVGSSEKRRVDVRLITATHQDLEAAIAGGRFREDFYYRIQGACLWVPPLRERKSDIPLLCAHFIREGNREQHKEVKGVSDQALRLLEAYEWPGNVRELEHVLKVAVALAKAEEIKAEHLRLGERQTTGTGEQEESLLCIIGSDSYAEALAQFERAFFSRALRLAQGNASQAAQRMKLSRRTLQAKIKRHQLRRKA